MLATAVTSRCTGLLSRCMYGYVLGDPTMLPPRNRRKQDYCYVVFLSVSSTLGLHGNSTCPLAIFFRNKCFISRDSDILPPRNFVANSPPPPHPQNDQSGADVWGNQDSQDRTTWTGQLEQDRQNIDSQNRTVRTRQPEKDSRRIARTW